MKYQRHPYNNIEYFIDMRPLEPGYDYIPPLHLNKYYTI